MVATAFGKVQAKVGDFDEQQGRLRTLPCYFALFALAELFYIIMTLDAVRPYPTIRQVLPADSPTDGHC